VALPEQGGASGGGAVCRLGTFSAYPSRFLLPYDERRPPEVDAVAAREQKRPVDAVAVDGGSIGRAQILDEQLTTGRTPEPGMPARELSIAREVGRRRLQAVNRQLIADLEPRPGGGTLRDLEPGPGKQAFDVPKPPWSRSAPIVRADALDSPAVGVMLARAASSGRSIESLNRR
jgi:hypothetical protein